MNTNTPALTNRLKKRFNHLKKWAKNTNITCFRVYDKDIPEYPLIIDWYCGNVVIWVYHRTLDDTPEKEENYISQCLEEIETGLNVNKSEIFLKRRLLQKGEKQYVKTSCENQAFTVQEQGLKFEVNLSDYLDTGIFLDHRNTRNLVRQKAKGKSVLNLFAYTGSFTCYAIDGGASQTVTVDISNTYCNWTARNFSLNHFEESPKNSIIVADCLAYIKDAKNRGLKFDIIICDPPTFSTSKKMADTSFVIDRDYAKLLSDCLKLLAVNGTIYFSTNSRGFILDETLLLENTKVKNITNFSIPEDFKNKKIHQCWEISKNS